MTQGEPLWWSILNLEDTAFERTRYADPNNPTKFRLKDINVLRKLAPNLYQSASDEVREYEEFLTETNGTLRKYRLGRKIGSIPLIDYALHPELANDPKAQDKYWKDHPEMKVHAPK